jgi:hypothetical protein
MANGGRKNPALAGILSGVMPGLGQFYCRQWGRGAGFLVGALAIDGGFGVSSGTLELLQSFGSPIPSDMLGTLLLGMLFFLAVAIWSILDAVRTAKKSSRLT